MNLELWEKLARPPKEALKTITGGRLNGKSDINPQWRMKSMTEAFGPCGEGWKYAIDKLWTHDGTEGQVMVFAQVSLHTRLPNGAWSDAIPGIGGSMLIAKEKGGMHSNDEGYKMAITDALSVAMKSLGVAADIYMGLWDGSKYKQTGLSHKPTDGAMEGLSAERQEVCRRVASSIVDAFEAGDTEGGYQAYIEGGKDNEEKTAIWAELGGFSAIRSKLKAMHKEKRIQEAA